MHHESQWIQHDWNGLEQVLDWILRLHASRRQWELLHLGDIAKENTFHISSPKRRHRTVPFQFWCTTEVNWMKRLPRTVLGLVHPCWHQLLHSHSPYCECMVNVTINIVNQVFVVGLRYLLYFVHSMLSVMRQIGYNLQITCDYRLSFAKYFLISSAHVLFERGRNNEAFY